MKPIPMKYDLDHIPSLFTYYSDIIAIHQPYMDESGTVQNIRQEYKNRFAGEVDPDREESVPSDTPIPLYEFIISKPALMSLVNHLVDQELHERGIPPRQVLDKS